VFARRLRSGGQQLEGLVPKTRTCSAIGGRHLGHEHQLRHCQDARHTHGKAPNVLLVDYPERAPRPELSVAHAAFMQVSYTLANFNKRNPHTDLLPFLTRQMHERFTLLSESGSSLEFHNFLACHSLVDTKTGYMTLRFASDCLMSVLRAQHRTGLPPGGCRR
jgi:hypothetical protein